jgi:hypothetical protein
VHTVDTFGVTEVTDVETTPGKSGDRDDVAALPFRRRATTSARRRHRSLSRRSTLNRKRIRAAAGRQGDHNLRSFLLIHPACSCSGPGLIGLRRVLDSSSVPPKIADRALNPDHGAVSEERRLV